jgi:hydroxymethylpyrimidine pyrophosphatase-like HAD family hydrolase
MIKKDKVYELKIEEEDEVSGIDSISLVDEPAIEINWMYFSKEKPHEFHIPDNEDSKYLDKLKSIAQNEQELFEEGWVVSKVTPLGKEGFITAPDPNGPSVEDETEYRVRYKYVLNPQAQSPSVIPTTRDFCRELVQKNYVWRLEDLDTLTNDEGDSALVWRGGYNCRHLWARIEYTLDSTIRNKASVNQGKKDPQAPLDTRVLGMEQPDTRVPEWPSFSKVKFEKVSIDYDDTLSTDRGKELAKRLLEQGKELVVVTRRRDEQMDEVRKVAKELGIDKVYNTNGQLKWKKLKELGIEKHIDNNPDEIKAIQDNVPSIQTEKFDYDVSTIGGYEDPGIKKKKQKKFAADEEKRTIIGPAMVPDLRIPRKDVQGNMYEVYFSSETIKMIAEKYMKNQYTRNNDLMHDGTAVKDVYVIESWIKEDENDKSTKYGYGDLPIGTWFVAMKCAKTPQGDKVWEMVKSGELAGYSVSGWFEEVAAFCREEMFLHKVVEILKKYE